MDDINLKKVAIAAVIALVVLFAANYLITDYRIERQLTEQLEQRSQVKTVKINKKPNYQLEISLENVDDLQEINLELHKEVTEILGTTDYQLQIKGLQSNNLKRIYNKINLSLYEAVVTGKYTKIGTEVEKCQQQYQLKKAEVNVDQKYIYVTLVDDTGALYKVLNRNKVKVGGSNG